MRIGRWQSRLSFGRRHTTVITLPIPKSASARCIVGVSPSTPPWSTPHGNRDVRMPTDFDEFTPAAMWPYMGSSFEIGGHVRLLNYAMHKAGFWGLRTEWWHFTIADWQKYLPPERAKSAAQVLGTHWEGGL